MNSHLATKLIGSFRPHQVHAVMSKTVSKLIHIIIFEYAIGRPAYLIVKNGPNKKMSHRSQGVSVDGGEVTLGAAEGMD